MRKCILYVIFLFFILSQVQASQTPTLIPPVIVRASQKNTFSLSNGPQQFISHEQIATAGVTSLTQLLANLGNLQIQSLVGNASQSLISMRGFGANASMNTLLLINGIPLTNPDLAPPDLNVLPISEVQAVEIIAGSESVLYGDQAVGGVINILTDVQVNPRVNLNCVVGNYQQRECLMSWQLSHGQLRNRFMLSGQQTNNYRVHNAYQQTYLSGQTNYLNIKDTINFNYHFTLENMQYPGALTAMQVRENRRQATNQIDYFKDSQAFFYLQEKHFFNNRWQLHTNMAAQIMNGNGVLSSPFVQSRHTYFIKPVLIAENNTSQFHGGFDLQQDSYHLSSRFGVTEDSQQKYGLFGLANVFLTSRVGLAFGMRGAEQLANLQSMTIANETVNRALATTLGLSFHYSPDINLYLRRAGSFRFPKADENADSTQLDGLRTQRGVSYETGISVNKATYATKINIYQLNLKDEIAFDPLQTPMQPFGTNKNLSPTIRYGLSMSAKKILTEKLILNGQYNYVNASFKTGINAGKKIPLVAENLLRVGCEYHFNDYWQVYAETIYTGKEFAANDYANVAGAVGGYAIYNLNLHFNYRQFTAALRADNIFNKYYYFYTVYQMGSEYFYPAPTRSITLTMNYAFT